MEELFGTFFEKALTIIIAAFGWFFKILYGKINRVEKNNHELALLVAQEYSKRSELREMEDRLTTHLVRIEDKLDKKVDK